MERHRFAFIQSKRRRFDNVVQMLYTFVCKRNIILESHTKYSLLDMDIGLELSFDMSIKESLPTYCNSTSRNKDSLLDLLPDKYNKLSVFNCDEKILNLIQHFFILCGILILIVAKCM